jgi:hypothetical protein
MLSGFVGARLAAQVPCAKMPAILAVRLAA